MLTRIELIGFKSFADRTRLDFPAGITCVVGPNGSGKSNVVDAVRWVLGEQSAKTLRGGEMADVIFNGSSTRKSLGMAEVTMTFDNAKRILRYDADEVQVTRRVFRDGQGEYAINGQDARLKDVKDLFLGTGAGHSAYSIIEQGRVDALLTASTTDRRLIFEEAAGVSRFKAKKLEAMRKLDRVNADLTRVKDVLGELDKNLRTLGAQAAKAEKYQEYHDRLKAVRVAVGAAEFAKLSETLAAEEGELAALTAELADTTARTAAGEAELKKLDWDLARTDETLRHQEKRRADAKQQIAGHEATSRAEADRAAAAAAERLRAARQRADAAGRLHTLEADAATAERIRDAAAGETATADARAADAASGLASISAVIAELTRQSQADRDRQFDLVGRAAQFHSAAAAARTQADRMRKDLSRKQADAARAAAEAAALKRVLADLTRDDAGLRDRLAAAQTSAAELAAEQAGLRKHADDLQPELDAARDRRGDLRGRAEVLEGLERNLEGFGAGVRAVIAAANAPGSAVADVVVGLVADLLDAPADAAALVDVALGDAAQRFVVRDAVGLDAAVAKLGDLPGRVGFVTLPESPVEVPGDSLAAVVSCAVPGVAGKLLGNVFVAADLAAARRLAAARPGARVVTRAGELLDADGTLTVGPPRTDAGILSRKSELRELRVQAARLDERILAAEAEQLDRRRRADALSAPLSGLAAEVAALTGEAGGLRDRIVEHRQKFAQLTDAVELLGQESGFVERELEKADAAFRDAAAAAGEADREAAVVKTRLGTTASDLHSAEAARDARQRDHTAAQVELGELRQKLAGLTARAAELATEVRLRKIDAGNLAQAEKAAAGRETDSTLAALRATTAAAVAYAEVDVRTGKILALTATRDAAKAARDKVTADLATARAGTHDRRAAAHARELSVRDATHKRAALAARLKDDYAIDLASLNPPPPLDSANPDEEIDELKRKLAKLGSVNLEALEQLAAERTREADYRGQYDDLTSAERSLLDVIEEINRDSRRLFTETLTAVRGQFQELFRKLFGGGMADIVLEDDTDVLESGIEITARPPGKELRSISLMSGGEKTLTAVALLLAIFRSKPSPFCLLDEVDAALDEANAVRLAGVLQEFKERSQFIVITHKKRTMAAADVLHGITMQEGGVSKRIPLRFEDWPEDRPATAA